MYSGDASHVAMHFHLGRIRRSRLPFQRRLPQLLQLPRLRSAGRELPVRLRPALRLQRLRILGLRRMWRLQRVWQLQQLRRGSMWLDWLRTSVRDSIAQQSDEHEPCLRHEVTDEPAAIAAHESFSCD